MGFSASDGKIVVQELTEVIAANRQYLSDIDGAIGDGDHGINMAKGFSMAAERLEDSMDLSESLKTLGTVLMMEIGGSMGPLYGKFFRSLAKESKGLDEISILDISRMLHAGYEAVKEIGGAKPGDKTLLDALDPAIAALDRSIDAGDGFAEALDAMTRAAEKGKESTKDMIAKIGRAARLGERSRGALDAGAASCWLILDSMARTIAGHLR